MPKKITNLKIRSNIIKSTVAGRSTTDISEFYAIIETGVKKNE